MWLVRIEQTPDRPLKSTLSAPTHQMAPSGALLGKQDCWLSDLGTRETLQDVKVVLSFPWDQLIAVRPKPAHSGAQSVCFELRPAAGLPHVVCHSFSIGCWTKLFGKIDRSQSVFVFWVLYVNPSSHLAVATPNPWPPLEPWLQLKSRSPLTSHWWVFTATTLHHHQHFAVSRGSLGTPTHQLSNPYLFL